MSLKHSNKEKNLVVDDEASIRRIWAQAFYDWLPTSSQPPMVKKL